MHHNAPSSNQAHQPQHKKHQHRNQQQLGIMQKGQRIVPQKRDVRVIRKGREIECIPEEGSQEIARISGEDWEQDKLEDVEVEVEGEEGSV